MTAGISLIPGKPALIERRYSKSQNLDSIILQHLLVCETDFTGNVRLYGERIGGDGLAAEKKNTRCAGKSPGARVWMDAAHDSNMSRRKIVKVHVAGLQLPVKRSDGEVTSKGDNSGVGCGKTRTVEDRLCCPVEDSRISDCPKHRIATVNINQLAFGLF